MFDLRELEAAEQLQLVTISKCNCNHRLARYLPWLQYIREGKNLTRKVWFRLKTLNVLQNGNKLKNNLYLNEYPCYTLARRANPGVTEVLLSFLFRLLFHERNTWWC